METFKTFLKAILAGGAIALGCIANICSQNKIAGSLFFVIGLFLVLAYDLNLFTGKICFAVGQDKKYVINLIIIYIGNFVGTFILGSLFGGINKFSELISEYSVGLQARMNTPWLQTIVLGYLCNVCIYVAVNGFKRSTKHSWMPLMSLVLGVSVFVLCGFEHCIADMVYITMCGLWGWQSLWFVLLVTAGNILGGLTMSATENFLK